jgi:hypothetical protein
MSRLLKAKEKIEQKSLNGAIKHLGLLDSTILHLKHDGKIVLTGAKYILVAKKTSSGLY